jgi:hypothetical protein
MDRAAVPEASPDLYDEPCTNEYDVVASASLADYRTVYPVAETAPVELSAKSKFWPGIAARLGAHPSERSCR